MLYQDALNQTFKHYNLSAREMAQRCDVTETTLSRFKRSDSTITLSTWHNIVGALSPQARKYLNSLIFISELKKSDIPLFLNIISLLLTCEDPEIIRLSFRDLIDH